MPHNVSVDCLKHWAINATDAQRVLQWWWTRGYALSCCLRPLNSSCVLCVHSYACLPTSFHSGPPCKPSCLQVAHIILLQSRRVGDVDKCVRAHRSGKACIMGGIKVQTLRDQGTLKLGHWHKVRGENPEPSTRNIKPTNLQPKMIYPNAQVVSAAGDSKLSHWQAKMPLTWCYTPIPTAAPVCT